MEQGLTKKLKGSDGLPVPVGDDNPKSEAGGTVHNESPRYMYIKIFFTIIPFLCLSFLFSLGEGKGFGGGKVLIGKLEH